MSGFAVALKFEPRDLWVGIYWNYIYRWSSAQDCLEIYVCVLPMLPIKVELRRWTR